MKIKIIMLLIIGISVANVCSSQSDSFSIDPFIGAGPSVGNVSHMAGFRLPAVSTDALSLIAGHQKHVEATFPDGASIMISSEPVIIQNQVSKNIFMANIPNDRGGYATVMIQKVGNGFIELPGAVL